MRDNKTKKTTQDTPANGRAFSEEERAAMRQRAEELRMDKKDGEKALLVKIDEMPEHDQALAKKIHAIVKANAPELAPKTWYGMPAYANKDGKVVCFFQSSHKFQYRYATLGFQDLAKLDDGDMWATSYALMNLNDAEEKKIIALVKKAVS